MRKQPRHNLTKSQQTEALKLAGTMYRKDIENRIGCSHSSLQRFAREHKNINWNFHKYKKQIVDEVTEYYVEHGKRATEKNFPKIKVRSIVERYLKDLNPRQKRWTDKEIVEALKMAGLISYGAQAIYFNRPRANAGSIRALWDNRLKIKAHRVNGLHYNIAKYYVKKSCPFYACRINDRGLNQWKALWIDVYKHLKDDVPDHIKLTIRTLAEFQIWLHGKNAKSNIENMISERQ